MPLDDDFPLLDTNNHRITSPATPVYNCVAWALHDTTAFWDPSPLNYWPRRIPKNRLIETLVQLLRSHGLDECDDGECQSGIEKLALYSADGIKYTHVARQLDSGEWTSKLGRLEDITHTNCECLEDSDYGTVVRWMKRTRQ